jgi:hypothetical protein
MKIKPKVLFLGCNYDEIPYLKTLQERGFHVVATDINPDAPGMKLADSEIICGYDDFKCLDKAISKEGFENFAMVFTASSQFAHIGASHISKQLGLPYPSMDSIRACLDKTAFYPLFQKNGISIPDTYYVKNLSELKGVLSKYPKEADFYLKSDYSKNPNHIYTGTSESLIEQKIQWTPDRYFREYYVLQQTYVGYGVRLNLFPNDYELYEFETGKAIDRDDCPQLEDYKILELLRMLSEKLGMQNWLLKFDILISQDGYVVLDIGMDPPYRMKKSWEKSGRNFVDFYLDLYLKAKDNI